MTNFKQKYTEHLQSDKWQAIRKAKAREQNYTCQKCRKVVFTGFHIHHKTYKNLGNEPLSDLMFLCEDCHIKLHIEKAKRQKKKAVKLPPKRKKTKKKRRNAVKRTERRLKRTKTNSTISYRKRIISLKIEIKGVL